MRCVLDTNVIVSALRSPRGASAAVIRTARLGRLLPIITPALFLEYEAVCSRQHHLLSTGLAKADVDLFLDAIFAMSVQTRTFFTLRPTLRDPDDEMVLEAAANGRAAVIVTFNLRDFSEARRFGILALRPGAVLAKLRMADPDVANDRDA